jgi:hypothetical protein
MSIRPMDYNHAYINQHSMLLNQISAIKVLDVKAVTLEEVWPHDQPL